MSAHETIIKTFFETGRRYEMDSFALEKAVIGILALMASYRANPGEKLNYLQGLAAAANRVRSESW